MVNNNGTTPSNKDKRLLFIYFFLVDHNMVINLKQIIFRNYNIKLCYRLHGYLISVNREVRH